MWSQKFTKLLVLFLLSAKDWERFYVCQFLVFFCFCVFFKVVFRTHQLFIFDKSETAFSKQFSLTFQFCFVIYTLKCIEVCVNGDTKCVTAQFYPLEVQIFKKILQSIFTDNLSHFVTNLRPHNQNFYATFFVFYFKLQGIQKHV